MSEERRMAQSVVDGLEDLEIFDGDGSLYSIEDLIGDDGKTTKKRETLEDMLMSMLSAPCSVDCPFPEPTLLERLHFATIRLMQQRMELKRSHEIFSMEKEAPPLSLSSSSLLWKDGDDEQLCVIRACEDYLENDTNQRIKHMQQRLEILKATFHHGEDHDHVDPTHHIHNDDVDSSIESEECKELSISMMAKLFLQPSTTLSSSSSTVRVVRAVDELVEKMAADRGGRVAQTESRNSMPEFKTTLKANSGSSNNGNKKKLKGRNQKNKEKKDGEENDGEAKAKPEPNTNGRNSMGLQEDVFSTVKVAPVASSAAFVRKNNNDSDCNASEESKATVMEPKETEAYKEEEGEDHNPNDDSRKHHQQQPAKNKKGRGKAATGDSAAGRPRNNNRRKKKQQTETPTPTTATVGGGNDDKKEREDIGESVKQAATVKAAETEQHQQENKQRDSGKKKRRKKNVKKGGD